MIAMYITNKIENFVVKLNRAFPSFFSKVHDEIISMKKLDYQGLEKASLFKTEADWKTVTITVKIENEEFNKLKDKLKKKGNILFVSNFHKVANSSYVSENGITDIFLKTSNGFRKGSSFSELFISITKLNYGLTFLHFTYSIEKEKNKLINNVDVSKEKGKFKFKINEYKRLIIDYIDNKRCAHQIIRNNIDNIIDESIDLTKMKCKEFGVKLNKGKTITSVEISLEPKNFINDENYDIERNTYLTKEELFTNEHGIEIIENIYDLPPFIVSDKIQEMYVKLEQDLVKLTTNDYIEIGAICQIHNEEFQKVRESLNQLLLKNVKIEDLYNDLLLGKEKLNRLIENNRAIKEKITTLQECNLKSNLLKYLNRVDDESSKIYQVLEIRMETSNNLFQLSNINYTKKISALVFVMTVIQVVIAFYDEIEVIVKRTLEWLI